MNVPWQVVKKIGLQKNVFYIADRFLKDRHLHVSFTARWTLFHSYSNAMRFLLIGWSVILPFVIFGLRRYYVAGSWMIYWPIKIVEVFCVTHDQCS
jgi:hypothetical protein